MSWVITKLKVFTKSITKLILSWLRSGYRLRPYRVFKIKCKPSNVSSTAIIEPKQNVTMRTTTEIKDYCIIRSYESTVTIGEYSQINPFCVIYGGAGVQIGNNVMIGPHTVIAAGSHEYRNLDIPMRHAGCFDLGPIVILDDVWIGANCTITDGVTIGMGAIVGANSVVTRNVDAYDIVAGCPARKISSRTIYRKTIKE